jgi:hypothetical protein
MEIRWLQFGLSSARLRARAGAWLMAHEDPSSRMATFMLKWALRYQAVARRLAGLRHPEEVDRPVMLWERRSEGFVAFAETPSGAAELFLVICQQGRQWGWAVWRPDDPPARLCHGQASAVQIAMRDAEEAVWIRLRRAAQSHVQAIEATLLNYQLSSDMMRGAGSFDP